MKTSGTYQYLIPNTPKAGKPGDDLPVDIEWRFHRGDPLVGLPAHVSIETATINGHDVQEAFRDAGLLNEEDVEIAILESLSLE